MRSDGEELVHQRRRVDRDERLCGEGGEVVSRRAEREHADRPVVQPRRTAPASGAHPLQRNVALVRVVRELPDEAASRSGLAGLCLDARLLRGQELLLRDAYGKVPGKV